MQSIIHLYVVVHIAADLSFTYLHNSLGIRLLISWHQREWSGETRSWMKWVTYSDDWSLTDAFGADKSDGQSLGSSASIFTTHISAGHWQEFFISYFFLKFPVFWRKKIDKRKMGMITSRLLIHSLIDTNSKRENLYNESSSCRFFFVSGCRLFFSFF